jgi:hypothetical protein
MKTLKLEVGKSYRSRAGEEVRIVRKNNKGWVYWEGSNGGWYYEGGKGSFAAEEHPKDLIEEVTISDANQNHNKMKTLKLQVGKTYRNRKGEEVKIIGTKDSMWPFVGDNEESYDEQGRYYSANSDSPDDLIEEVRIEPTSHTFDIPDGVKKVTVEQVGNRIVVEMVPEEDKGPKPGDVMINKHGSVYIFKSVVDDDNHEHYAWLGEYGYLSFEDMCDPGRPATPEEAQRLWDALKKAGKRWNAETMQVEEITEADRIREWVENHLYDGFYTHQGIARAIGYYLKYREGEK